MSAPPLTSILLFEFTSVVGRYLKKRKSKIIPNGTPLLLDIGVGANFTDGWTHVDFFSLGLRFWRHRQRRRAEIETDLRYPLHCQSNVVDGVYTGHTLEHLYSDHAYQLLAEVFRILKPGCWLRINVPDLERCVEFYTGKTTMPGYDFQYGAEAIGNLTQNWGHHSVWDEDLLRAALTSVGFQEVRKVEFGGTGTDRRLIKEEEGKRLETLVMEAQKPFNQEGCVGAKQD